MLFCYDSPIRLIHFITLDAMPQHVPFDLVTCFGNTSYMDLLSELVMHFCLFLWLARHSVLGLEYVLP